MPDIRALLRASVLPAASEETESASPSKSQDDVVHTSYSFVRYACFAQARAYKTEISLNCLKSSCRSLLQGRSDAEVSGQQQVHLAYLKWSAYKQVWHVCTPDIHKICCAAASIMQTAILLPGTHIEVQNHQGMHQPLDSSLPSD